jgi:zinc transporter 5/7
VDVTPDSIPSKLLPQLFLANVLFVLSLHAGKEWLLDFDVGVFWVVMRVLACGGLGVLVWEGMTGQLAKRKTIEERFTADTMVTHLLIPVGPF